MSQTVLLSVTEVSGDRHAARLVKALRKLDPTLEFVGVGGQYLASEGVDLLDYSTDKGTFGFVEVLRHVPGYLTMLGKIKHAFKRLKPALFIAVDAQGFNMTVCAAAKKLGVPVAYYIAPQEWHWGTEKGGYKVTEVTDLILSIFQPEYEFYKRLGGNATLIGHPLLDLVQVDIDAVEMKTRLGLRPDATVLTVFPGSRYQELDRLYPDLLEAALKTQTQISGSEIVVSVADPIFKERIESMTTTLAQDKPVHIYSGNSYDLMNAASFSFTASGTATLEHTLLGVPAVVAAKLHPLSYWIARLTFGKKWDESIKYVSLPNILSDRMLMPEFIQNEVSSEQLSQVALSYLKDPQKMAEYKADLASVKPLLGEPGGVARAAKAIVSFIKGQKNND